MTDLPRLQSVLGAESLARLLDSLVARIEHGAALAGTITLSDPSERERDAVDRLMGRPSSQSRVVRVRLDQLEQVIRNGVLAESLREAVEALRGPCVDRRDQQQQEQARWESLWATARSRIVGRIELAKWLDSLRRDGTLRRLASGDASKAEHLLSGAINVLDRLPTKGLLLAELAATVCGSSHALDPGQPVATLVVRALTFLRGDVATGDRTSSRALWDGFGVVCDELSGPVLVLNLLAHGSSCLARALAIHAAAGEPYRISTRQLLQELDIQFAPHGCTVYICENVNVLANAARRCGPACKPMVCIDGNPRTAARLLLDRLKAGGARLLYHGDFDWAGIGIANLVRSRHGTEPWQMSATDYEAYAADGTRLVGQPIVATWDSQLCDAMQRHRKAVHEELVMESLLSDLAVARDSSDRLTGGMSR